MAIARSRFVSHRLTTGRSPQEVRKGLEKHLSENPQTYSWVVIADEPLLRTFLVEPATPELARLAPITADPARLARVLSKIAFTEDAAAAGVPVPNYRVLATVEDNPRQTWRGVPTVAKAEESLSGSGVRLIQNPDDLAAVNAEMTARPMLFQEFKLGRVGATAVLFDHGNPLCWFSYLLARNWPNALAAASALETFWHPDLEPIVCKLGAMTGFHGLCGFDWILDENTGHPLVLELNPRPTPGIYLSRLAGVDFSLAIRQWLAGRGSLQKPSAQAAGLSRMFPQNLYRAIDDRDPLEFFRTWSDAPLTDPSLLASQLRRVVTHYFPTSWRQSWKDRFRHR